MSTRSWTNPATGRTYITVNGDQVRIDARPPDGYTPIPPAPVGYALIGCRTCGKPLAATLAARGTHLLCPPATRLLMICGAGRTWHTLIPVYRGERTWTGAPAELPAPAQTGGVAA